MFLWGNENRIACPSWIRICFAWQEGYGAFSVGVSGIEPTVAYIRNQEEHHRSRSFREEFLIMLRKHGLDYERECSIETLFRPLTGLATTNLLPQR